MKIATIKLNELKKQYEFACNEYVQKFCNKQEMDFEGWVNNDVGGCLSPIEKLESIMSKFGEAHNMLSRTKLSKEEYQPISSLLATAKVELFNYYYELKTGVQK